MAAPASEPSTIAFDASGQSQSTVGMPPVPPPSAAPLAAPPAGPPPAPPGYEILRKLGRGGMGVVYQARHLQLGRVVALKMILAGAHADTADRVRFLAEARAVAQLQHPHIVQIFEIGEHAGLPYFTLEYVAGGTLAELLRQRPLGPREAAALVEQLARGVAYAHEHGVVHRDLKPENVLLAEGREQGTGNREQAAGDNTPGARGSEGRGSSLFSVPCSLFPKIADFGLAKRVDTGEEFTASGTVLGTPSYMAPEQAAGQTHSVGPLADVYALGAILYRALTGRPPFQAATALETLSQVLNADAAAPSQLNPQVPRDLETICLKCLHKDRGRRYASAAALADDLGRFLAGEPILARPVGRVERALKWARRKPAQAAVLAVSVAAALALLGGGLWFTEELRGERDHAWYQEGQAQIARLDAERQKREADRAWKEAAAKAQAEMEARQAREAMVTDLYTGNGLSLRGDVAPAVLWFAHAARLSGDPARAMAERTRAASYLRTVPRPVAAVVHAGPWLPDAAWHPDGRHLLTHAFDPARGSGESQLWDLKTEAALPLSVGSDPGKADSISAAAWNASGEQLAVGTSGGLVVVLEFPSRKEVQRFTMAGRVQRLLFSADAGYLAVAAGKVARVWGTAEAAFVTPELNHPDTVTTLALHPKGTQLATGCQDHFCRVFAVPSDQDQPAFPAIRHYQEALRVVGQKPQPPIYVDQGRGLLTLSQHVVTWWNTANGMSVRTVRYPPPDVKIKTTVEHLIVAPDGVTFVLLNDMQAVVARGTGGPPKTIPLGHRYENYILSAAVSPDGTLLATASGDRTVRLCRLADGTAVGGPLLHATSADLAAFSADGKRLLTSMRGGLLRLWELPAAPALYKLPNSKAFSLVRLTADGRYVMHSGGSSRWSEARGTRVHEAATGIAAGPPLPAGGIVTDAAFSPDGRTLALAASLAGTPGERASRPGKQRGRLTLWDWHDGKPVGQPLAFDVEPRSVAYNAAGDRLVALDAAGTVYVIDAATAQVVKQWQAHAPHLENNHHLQNGSACFTPDGKWVLTFGTDEVVLLWDPATGERWAELKHRGPVHTVRFSADGKGLATAAFDGSARVWDLFNGRLLAELSHPDWVFLAEFSGDGKQLLTTCRDGAARVWDWQRHRLAAPPLDDDTNTYWAAFVPNERRVVTLGRDDTLRVWETDTGKPLSPPLPIGGPGLMVLVTPDGTRALAAGFLPAVTAFDLTAWLAPSPLGPAELCTYGELVCGQRVHEGRGLTTLTAEEWLERWRGFKGKH
jgi:WD40 repeat protein